MFKSEKQLLENANFAIDTINLKFREKKIVGMLVVYNFLSKNSENQVFETRHQNNMTFYPLDVDFQYLNLKSVSNKGMYHEFDLQWDVILNALLEEKSINKEQPVSALLRDIDSCQLVHSSKEIYSTYLRLDDSGYIIVLYDNLADYFEDATFSVSNGEQEIEKIITKEDGLDILLKLQSNDTQHQIHQIDEKNSYNNIVNRVQHENFKFLHNAIRGIFEDQTKNNQLLQVLLLNS